MPKQDSRDFTDKYNTKLSDKEEAQFQEEMKGRLNDLYDYDLRGAWKEAKDNREELLSQDPTGLARFMLKDDLFGEGHLADKYKKPNHITFSDESKYHGMDGYEGGHWSKDGSSYVYTPSETSMYSDAERENYWMKGDEYANANHLNNSNGERLITGQGSISQGPTGLAAIANDIKHNFYKEVLKDTPASPNPLATYLRETPNDEILGDAASIGSVVLPVGAMVKTGLAGIMKTPQLAALGREAIKNLVTGFGREGLENYAINNLPESIQKQVNGLDATRDGFVSVKALRKLAR